MIHYDVRHNIQVYVTHVLMATDRHGSHKCCDLMRLGLTKLIKGKALRKHSLHEKTAASVLLKLFISSNE